MGTLSDYYNSKKKDKDSTETKKKAGALSDYYNFTFASSIPSRLEALQTEGTKAYDTYKSRFFDENGEYIHNYRGDSQDAYNAYSQFKTKYDTESKEILDFLDKYGDAFDADTAEKIRGYFTETSKSYDDMLNAYKTDTDYWSKWKTEDDYKAAVKATEDYEAMKVADTVALGEELEGLKAKRKEYVGIKTKRDNRYSTVLSGYMRAGYTKAQAEQKALEDAEVAAYDKQLSVYGDMSSIDNDISNKDAYISNALSVQKDEKYRTEYDINGLIELRDKAESEGNAEDYAYFSALADEKQLEGIAEILSNTKMDGEDVSILYAIGDLSYIKDEEERKEREKAIRDKTASLGIDFDTYYSQLTGEKNINGKGVGQWVHHSVFSGLDSWNKGISSTLDLILGKPMQALGWENNPISSMADYYAISYAKNAYARELEARKMGGGQVLEKGGQFIEGLVGAVPDAVLAFMTGGVSKADTLTKTAAYASGGKLARAGLTVQNMVRNPSYWASFARTYGLDYEEAKAMGVSDTAAVFGATISSLVNAGIEIGIDGGSGIQGFAQDLAEGNKNRFFAWVESSLEEGGEEILQGFVNNLVAKTMYDDSVALANIEEMVAEGAMGVGIGAVLGGGQTITADVLNKVKQNAAMNDEYRKTGKYILNNGGTDALKELALKYATEMTGRPGKTLAKSANAISNDSKPIEVGKLAKKVNGIRSDLNKADIKAALVKRGVNVDKAENYANILVAMNEEYFNGESDSFTLGTNEQWKKMTGDKDAYSILSEIVTDERSSVNNRNKKMAYAVQGIRMDNEGNVNESDYEAFQERVYAKLTGAGLASNVDNTQEVSDDGKTYANLDGTSVEVTSKEFVEDENGTLKLKVNGGQVVGTDSVEYGDIGDAYVVSAILDLGVGVEDANAMYSMFKGKGEKAGKSFANGISLAFKYGRYLQSPEKLANIAGVTEAQAKEAYKIGKKSRRSEAAATQSTLNEIAEANEKEGKKASAKGSVVFEGEIADENGNLAAGEDSLTDIQKASVNGIKLLAELSPINFHIFQSTKDGKTFTYVKKNGKKVHANGWYVIGTNDIYIDLNAGNDGQGVMMYTAAHEISHFIKQYSPEKWEKVAEYVLNEYTARYGSDIETLLMRQIAKVKSREDSKGKTTQEIEDEAFEELVCDSLSKMLIDGSVVQAMTNIKQKNKGVWNTIKNAVQKLLDKWSAIIDQYRGRTPDAEEAGYFQETSKSFKKLQQLLTDAFVDAGETYSKVGNLKSSENDMMSNRNTAEENKALKEFGKDIGTVERNDNGDLLIATNEDNSTVMYSERTWNEGGKEKFISLMEALGHGDQAQEYAKYLDDALDYLHELAVGYEVLGQHLDATITTDIKNGKQVLSAIVNNGEYPVNIDLALICKKRVAYMRLMAKMIEDGVFGDVKYDGDAIAEVNGILRKNGFETACLGCFVESRRLQFQTWAETIVQEWNEAVEAHSNNAKYFRFADGKASLTDAEIEALENELENGGEKNDKGNLNLGQGSVADKMGRLLDKVPSLARKLTVDDLLTPQGLTALRATDANLFSLVKQRYGAASPKIVQDYNPYASEIADLTFNFVKGVTGNAVKGAQDYIKAAKAELINEQPPKSIPKQRKKESDEDYKARKDEFETKKKAYNTKVEALAMRKYLYSIGGARIQSFSDFMIENVFDYLQIFADLSAKELPMHGYTKEIVALRLFGMTGAKWNGSLIAHVEKSMGKEYAGLLPASEAKDGKGILVKVDGKEYCIAFDDFARNKATNGESFIQSIGMKDIVALMYDPRYSANVGNITIGVSDKQIMAMLDSPLFRMVIPYHASGMLPQFAQLVGVDMYNDYTNYQNTTVKEVRLLEGVPYKVEIGDSGKPVVKNADGDKISIDTHYAFNEKLQKYGDARKTCNDYLAWCRNDHAIYDKGKLIGYATFNPKFSDSPTGVDFTKHRNYYKLIEDFNTYDNITENAAQQDAVTMTFPSAENRLTAEQKKAYEKALRDTGIFTEADIKKYLEKADMTFEDIVRAEVGNRKAYNDAQEPKFNSTVKEVEDFLLNAKDEKGNYKFRRDAVADTASDYIEGKKQGISLRPARGSYLDEVVLSDRDGIRKFDGSEERLTENIKILAGMNSVYDVPASALEDSGKEIQDIYKDFFDEWGGELFSEELGTIDVKPSSIRSERRHGNTAKKIAAIEAIPTVVGNGKVIFAREKNNGRILRIVVAAPIEIAGKPYYMGVMVQRDNQYQRLYLHDVVIEEETSTSSLADLLTTGANEENERLFVTTILQRALNVKYSTKKEKLSDSTYDTDIRYSERVTDKKTLDFLNDQIDRGEYITVYRSFQVIDGGLYAPMNAVDRDEDGKNKRLGYRSEIGQWEKATESKAIAQRYMDEHPDAPYAKFDLDGGDNKTGGVAYNPYLHASNLVLNDQFSAAYRRNLVTVECRVPLSEAEGAYKAEYAKDGTGWANWKAGGVANRLNKIKPEYERRLFLSRYMLPVKVLSDEEVASMYKEYLDGTDISVPWNVVTPSLRNELEKAGVSISYEDVKRSSGLLKFEEQFPEEKSKALYQDRDPGATSTRALLANALESTIDTSTQEGQHELRKLNEYKEMVGTLDELTAKLNELRSSLFSKGVTGAERRRIQDEATKTANRISIYDKKLLTLEASKPLKKVLEREKAQAVKKQKKKDAADFAAYKEATKKAQAEKIERLKEANKKVRETRDKNEAKANLQKLVLETARWISYPKKEDVKCPDFLRVPYAKFLESIDFSSKTLLETGEATKNDEKMALAMGKLANAIEKVKNAQNPATDAGEVLDSGYLDLPAKFVEDLRELAEKTEALIIDGDFVINRMSSADIKSLTKLVTTLNHSIREMGTVYSILRFANVGQLGDNSISFLEELGEIESTNAVGDFVAWDNALPYYAFKRFGKGGEAVFEAFMDAQDKLAYLADDILKFRNGAWTDKEVRAWSDDTHTIELPSGKTLTLTTADAMSIYCLARRDNNQGLKHLVGGGVRVIGQQNGAKTTKDSRVNLDLNDVQAICSSLDERQKAVAESIQEFMSTVCSEWGNEISMKRFLTKDFTEKRYFPIQSNDEVMAVKDPQAQQSDLYRLLNISATKPLTPDANNSVIIRNIFDVFTEHSSDMARLNAFGMPMLDVMKWLNYNEKTTSDNGQITVRGVRGAMQKAYGDKARSYVINLIKDINGRFNDGGDHPWLMKMTKQAKTAMVGSSLRVAVLQLTALPRASMVLSVGNIAKGFKRLPQISKAKKYCGIALWKSFGFYDTNISRSIEDQIKGATNVRQKLIELSLKGAEWGDAITWGYLWNACEYEVANTSKHLKVGTEEFNQAVGKKLREVVYATQVVDSTLTRSQIMRNKSGLTQAVTAFMSEPTVSANILMDAGFQFHLEKRRTGSAKAAWKKVGGYVGKAITVYTVGQLIAALVEGLMDAYRDDDDDEFIEKFGREFLENAITDVVPFNKIPILSDVTEFILSLLNVGYFSSDRLDTAWLMQMASAMDSWSEVLGGDNTSTTYYDAIYKTVRSLSTMTGLPVGNLMREVVTLWNNTAGAANPYLKIRAYESSSTNVDIAENAFDRGDAGTVKKTVSKMVQDKVDSGKDEKEAKSAVRSSFTSRYKAQYVAAIKRRDMSEANRIRKLLYATGLYGTLTELDNTLKKWRTEE